MRRLAMVVRKIVDNRPNLEAPTVVDVSIDRNEDRRLGEPVNRLEATGQLGEVYQIITRRHGPFPARIAGAGVKDLATHDIDLTAWVAQQPYVSVAARTTHKSGREYEDLVAVTGQLADSTVTSHLVS